MKTILALGRLTVGIVASLFLVASVPGESSGSPQPKSAAKYVAYKLQAEARQVAPGKNR